MSCIVGSSEPPLWITFFGGGHGGNEEERGFVGLFETSPVVFGFPESSAVGFTAVVEFVQLGVFFLRRRCGCGDGFAGSEAPAAFPVGAGGAGAGSLLCVGGAGSGDWTCPADSCPTNPRTPGGSQAILRK